MHVDWIVAMVAFFVFVGWAFGYYSGFFGEKAEPLEKEVSAINEEMLDFLLVDSYTLPVSFYSDNVTSGSVLYFDFSFPSGTKNSTEVFSNQTSLSCMFEDDRIYWQADLAEGENNFRLEYSEVNVSMNCNSNFSIENKSMALPWVVESKEMVSQAKIDEMTSKPFEDFKRDLGIYRNFRVEIEGVSYGPSPPPVSNVYVKETNSKIIESDTDVKIRVLVW